MCLFALCSGRKLGAVLLEEGSGSPKTDQGKHIRKKREGFWGLVVLVHKPIPIQECATYQAPRQQWESGTS